MISSIKLLRNTHSHNLGPGSLCMLSVYAMPREFCYFARPTVGFAVWFGILYCGSIRFIYISSGDCRKSRVVPLEMLSHCSLCVQRLFYTSLSHFTSFTFLETSVFVYNFTDYNSSIFYLLLSPNPKAVRLSANSWAYVRVLRVALCGFRVLTTCAHQNSVATLSRYLHRCRDHVQRQLVNLILPLIFNCE